MAKRALRDSINIFGKDSAKFSRRTYNNYEKKKLLDYMRSFEPHASIGKVDDCVTRNETKFENVGYEVDGYIWTEQDAYHVEHYNAAVTDEFFETAIEA